MSVGGGKLAFMSLLLISICVIGTSCKEISPETIPGGKQGFSPNIMIDIGNISNGESKEGSGELVYYMDYPIFANSGSNQNIISWLSGLLSETQKESTQLKKDFAISWNPELHASFKELKGENITTYVYNTYRFVGGAHGESGIFTFHYDNIGTPIESSQLLKNSASGSYIKESLKKALQSKYESGTFYENDMFESGLNEFIKTPIFAFSGTNVVFYFQDYQIAPHSSGMPEVEIPYENIKDFFILPPKSDNGDLKSKKTSFLQKASTEKGKKNLLPSLEQVFAEDKIKYIALTFDDGPSKLYTSSLLDILEKYNAKATFYMLGKNAHYFKDIVKRVFNEGHEIGNHSWDHPQLTRLDREGIASQINRTNDEISQITGYTPTTFRPPYGAFNKEVQSAFTGTIILWGIDTLDWKTKNIDSNIKIATSQAKDGAIILFHDIHKTSVDSIEPIIKILQKKGYEFVTVSQLLSIDSPNKNLIGKTCTSGWTCKIKF